MSRLEACSTTAQPNNCRAGVPPAHQSHSGRETPVTSAPVPPVALIGIDDSPSPQTLTAEQCNKWHHALRPGSRFRVRSGESTGPTFRNPPVEKTSPHHADAMPRFLPRISLPGPLCADHLSQCPHIRRGIPGSPHDIVTGGPLETRHARALNRWSVFASFAMQPCDECDGSASICVICGQPCDGAMESVFICVICGRPLR
jgi:hypothetical protein